MKKEADVQEMPLALRRRLFEAATSANPSLFLAIQTSRAEPRMKGES